MILVIWNRNYNLAKVAAYILNECCAICNIKSTSITSDLPTTLSWQKGLRIDNHKLMWNNRPFQTGLTKAQGNSTETSKSLLLLNFCFYKFCTKHDCFENSSLTSKTHHAFITAFPKYLLRKHFIIVTNICTINMYVASCFSSLTTKIMFFLWGA